MNLVSWRTGLLCTWGGKGPVSIPPSLSPYKPLAAVLPVEISPVQNWQVTCKKRCPMFTSFWLRTLWDLKEYIFLSFLLATYRSLLPTVSLLCRKCGAEDETSAHILCRCEALAPLRHLYLGFFFLEPGDIMSISLGPSGALVKQRGSLEWLLGHKGPVI
jgi:hypothetical protein